MDVDRAGTAQAAAAVGERDAFGQDDLYVEMTFLRSMEEHGFDVSIRQAGIDFANSGYPLWCANNAGRVNLRKGIAPPDSGHPQFNKCPNDIDYQIEADFSGLIAPGLPNTVIELGEKFGRLMNYGDGVYAGQFMGAMYAEAFFEKIAALVELTLEGFAKVGKLNLAVAFGCTGGQHRSVMIAEDVCKRLRKAGYRVKVVHRDSPK